MNLLNLTKKNIKMKKKYKIILLYIFIKMKKRIK
jgi:hypothetical protein